MSGDADNEFFSDGLSEDLINALSRLPGLQVASRTSAFRFRGSDLDIRQIGRQLDVATVVEGSVRRAGTRLRITAQLVNVDNGYHLWSERYDRQMADVFEIQDEIVAAIVKAVVPALLGDASHAVERSTEQYRGLRAVPQRTALLASAIAGHAAPGHPKLRPGHKDRSGICNRLCGPRRLLRYPARVRLDFSRRGPAESVCCNGQGHGAGTCVVGSELFARLLLLLLRAGLAPGRAALPEGRRDQSSLLARAGVLRDLLIYGSDAPRRRSIIPRSRASWIRCRLSSTARPQPCSMRWGTSRTRSAPPGRRWSCNPTIFSRLWNLGVALSGLGKHEEAVQTLDRAAALSRAPMFVGLLGLAYARAGRRDDATRLLHELEDRGSRGEYVPAFARLTILIGLGDVPLMRQALPGSHG